MRGRAGAARLVRRDLAADEAPALRPAESDGEALQEPFMGGASEGGHSEPPLADAAPEPAPKELEESRS